MFPRFSSVVRLLILPAGVFLVLLMVMLEKDEVAFRRPRLPWNPDVTIEKFQGHNAVSSTDRSTQKPRTSLTESHTVADRVYSTTPFINPHNYSVILNPVKLCSDRDLYMLIYVHTSPNHFRHRQIIRQTWANPKVMQKFNSRIVFIIGMVPDKQVMDSILLEHSRYGDIVQENFVDSYRNLTYKAVAALKWLHFHCKHVKYVLKSDDDILVNFYSLVRQLDEQVGQNSSKLLMCNQWQRMHVIRDRRSKWYVPKEEFGPDYFPTYCSGSAYMMSKDVVDDMFRESFTTPFFWVDDYYVTGMLAAKIGVKHKPFNKAYFLNAKLALEKLKNDTSNSFVFYHVHNLDKVHSMWTVVQSRFESDTNYTATYYAKLTGVRNSVFNVSVSN